MPFNVHRWPTYFLGSASGSDMPDLKVKLGTPFANIQVDDQYLAIPKVTHNI